MKFKSILWCMFQIALIFTRGVLAYTPITTSCTPVNHFNNWYNNYKECNPSEWYSSYYDIWIISDA